jgi:surface antigen
LWRKAQVEALRGVMLAGLWRKLLSILLPICLAACASGNMLSRAEKDRSIITGSIRPNETASAITDEDTIRNAVTSVDPKKLDAAGVAWTNPSSGASGQITGLIEFQDNGKLCRSFTASVTRFDGVSLYHGEACLRNEGGWQLRAFAGA